MFERAVRAAETAAEAVVRARAAAVAEAYRAGVPGAVVMVSGDTVTVRARCLVRRWLENGLLRSIGGGR